MTVNMHRFNLGDSLRGLYHIVMTLGINRWKEIHLAKVQYDEDRYLEWQIIISTISYDENTNEFYYRPNKITDKYDSKEIGAVFSLLYNEIMNIVQNGLKEEENRQKQLVVTH